MPSGKARYNGPRNFSELVESDAIDIAPDFSEELRIGVRDFFPTEKFEDCDNLESEADAFASAILADASWAVSELEEARLSLPKQDIRAELEDLRGALVSTCKKLRTLSPDCDRLLGIAANPLAATSMSRAINRRRLKITGRNSS